MLLMSAQPERSTDLAGVREVLSLPSLEGARVVAGEAGLDRRIERVTVGEVPDIADWLEGGELVLSTLFAVAEDAAARLAFVDRIEKGGAVALFTKLGRFLDRLDPELLELADERGLPVIVVDEEIRWTDVVRDVYGHALGQRVGQLERAVAVQRELVRVAVEGGGYERLAETASRLLDRPVSVEDEQGRMLAAYPTYERVRLAGPQELADAARGENLAVRGDGTVSAPVSVGGMVMGAVGTTESVDEPLDLVDESVLAYAATVAAVLMGREQVRLETELRLRGDFLSEVHGALPGRHEDLLGKATLLGADLSSGVVVLATRIDPAATVGTGVSQLERSLGGYLIQQHRNTLVAMRGADVFAFLGAPKGDGPAAFEERGARLAERLAGHLKAAWPGGRHAVSRSRAHGPSELREALREAEIALEVAARLKEGPPVLTYDQVGSYRLLLALADADPDELAAFADETVGPVERAGEELMKTLVAYLETDGSVGEVASRLFLHRHSVRYRLDRITALTGLDPRSSEGRERLMLGLKARTLIAKLGGG